MTIVLILLEGWFRVAIQSEQCRKHMLACISSLQTGAPSTTPHHVHSMQHFHGQFVPLGCCHHLRSVALHDNLHKGRTASTALRMGFPVRDPCLPGWGLWISTGEIWAGWTTFHDKFKATLVLPRTVFVKGCSSRWGCFQPLETRRIIGY